MIEAFKAENGMWGIYQDGGLLYDPVFCKTTADAIVDLETSDTPPEDWDETSERLEQMGLPIPLDTIPPTPNRSD